MVGEDSYIRLKLAWIELLNDSFSVMNCAEDESFDS